MYQHEVPTHLINFLESVILLQNNLSWLDAVKQVAIEISEQNITN